MLTFAYKGYRWIHWWLFQHVQFFRAKNHIWINQYHCCLVVTYWSYLLLVEWDCFSFRLLYSFNLLFPSVNSSQGKTHNKPACLAVRMLTLDSSCTSQMCALEIFELKASDTNKQVEHRMILVRGRANSLFSYLFICFWLHQVFTVVCEIFIFRPEVEPGSLALGVQSLSHWTREVPKIHFLRESSTRGSGSTSGFQCGG